LPLVYHSAGAAAAFFATVAAGAAGEAFVQLRTRSPEGGDPSYRWMLLGSTTGFVLAFALSGVGGHLPGPGGLWVAIGLAAMWAGFALRAWSVRTLGRFFRVEVTVAAGQALVDTGPYARLRHPSYTGLLLFYLGVGIGLDSPLSVAAIFALPLAAVVNRIRHEEAELRRVLGDAYDAYARRTERLVPGVW
jgi:protein-S-isoprenylcysteine O-methyltransferase